MARRVTLESLRGKLNFEVGNIELPSYGVGSKDRLNHALRSAQEFLWADYDWPFLQIHRDVMVQKDSRYYDVPSDIDGQRILKVEVKYGGDYQIVEHGINHTMLFHEFDSDLGETYDPVLRWDFYYDTDNDAEQIEVWPVPGSNADATTKEFAVRITGMKKLGQLVEDSDRCDLDDMLIVKLAATRILSRDRADDAQQAQAEFERLYGKMKGNAQRDTQFKIGDCSEDVGRAPIRLRAVWGNKSGA